MKTIEYNDEFVVPSKVICIGRNYVEHIYELDNEIPENMVIFNKPNSAICEELKFFSNDTRFESEICFLMKNKQIDAIGIGLDLTHADIQNKLKMKGLPWERAKGFNGSAVFSKFVKLEEGLKNLRLVLFINDTLIQLAHYELMIYKPEEIINEINSFMDIEDGDIIMTGTPKGVANYKKGDIFVGKIFCGNTLLVEQEWVVK